MAYPPAVLPTNRTNATPQVDTHPADHNAVNAAVNDIVTEVNRHPRPLVYQLQQDPGINVLTSPSIVMEVNVGTLTAGRTYRIEFKCNVPNGSAAGTAANVSAVLSTATSAAYPTFTTLPGAGCNLYLPGAFAGSVYAFGFYVPATTTGLVIRSTMQVFAGTAPVAPTATNRVVVVTDEGVV